MLLKAQEVLTADTPIKYLSRWYVRVHAHVADEDSKFAWLQNSSTVSQQQWKWSVAGGELLQDARRLVTQRDTLAKSRGSWERPNTRGTELERGKLQFIINEVPKTAYAVKNLSRQLAKPSEADMHDLKQCLRYTLGHSDEWLYLTKPAETTRRPRSKSTQMHTRLATCDR